MYQQRRRHVSWLILSAAVVRFLVLRSSSFLFYKKKSTRALTRRIFA